MSVYRSPSGQRRDLLLPARPPRSRLTGTAGPGADDDAGQQQQRRQEDAEEGEEQAER